MGNTSTKTVTTKIKLVKIGNSRGFRVPDFILKQADLEEATLEFKAGSLIITPIKRKPREGWAENIRKIKKQFSNKPDELSDLVYIENEFDKTWEW